MSLFPDGDSGSCCRKEITDDVKELSTGLHLKVKMSRDVLWTCPLWVSSASEDWALWDQRPDDARCAARALSSAHDPELTWNIKRSQRQSRGHRFTQTQKRHYQESSGGDNSFSAVTLFIRREEKNVKMVKHYETYIIYSWNYTEEIKTSSSCLLSSPGPPQLLHLHLQTLDLVSELLLEEPVGLQSQVPLSLRLFASGSRWAR